MKSSTKKILIIGGTGFLGHHIVRRFVKKVFSNKHIFKSPRKTHSFNNVKYLKCDLNNFKKLNFFKNKNFDYVLVGGYVDHSNIKKYS